MDPVTAYKAARTARAVARRVHWKRWVAGGAALTLAAGALVGGAYTVLVGSTGRTAAAAISCAVPGGPPVGQLDAVQTRNAATYVQVGVGLGVPPRGLVVALAMALRESGLRNLPSQAVPESLTYPHDTYPDGSIPAGDLDSVGTAQQRAGWGSVADRMNVAAAARMFYIGGQGGQPGLLDVPGWERMPIWEAAQRVQNSRYPRAYAQWEPQALAAVEATLAATPGATPVAFCSGASTAIGPCPPSGLGAETGLTPDALFVLRCTAAQKPTTFGYGGVGSRGNKSDHPSGRAVDVMVGPGGRYPDATQLAYGWDVARWYEANADAFGVTYAIFAGRIWNAARADQGWRDYTHPSGGGGATLLHYDHVHVSVHGTAGTLLTGGQPAPTTGAP